jgi:hypothetical protein
VIGGNIGEEGDLLLGSFIKTKEGLFLTDESQERSLDNMVIAEKLRTCSLTDDRFTLNQKKGIERKVRMDVFSKTDDINPPISDLQQGEMGKLSQTLLYGEIALRKTQVGDEIFDEPLANQLLRRCCNPFPSDLIKNGFIWAR